MLGDTSDLIMSSVRANQRRILIVDDEAFNLIGLKSVIKTMSQFKGLAKLIDTASNGNEALEKAKAGMHARPHYTYCLVFMDLSMPEMDGFEATEALRELYENGQQPKIVACTGHVEAEFIAKAWRHDMDEIVSKPMQQPVLASILAEVIELVTAET